MTKNYNYKGSQKELSSSEKYSSKEAQEFWRSPKKVNENDVGKNDPSDYLSFNDGRTEMLFNKIKEILPNTDSKILELGPNAGRNLCYLYDNGYHDVYGIEINAEAVSLMQQENPTVANNIDIGTIEEGILKLQDQEFDLVFSMAVLEHISTESDFIFDQIKRISSKFIITIEDEVTTWSERHFPRNYQKVIENNTWKQISSSNCKEFNCLDDRFYFRVFENYE